MEPALIITAASPAYEASVLALVGSLNANWPGHPPVMVYDLGMGSETVAELEHASVPVRRVPAFCPHWRKHFTWKIWCIHDAPCSTYLWLDAGVCVLRPLPEAFAAAAAMGYFVQPNGFTLKDSVCEPLRRHFGLDTATLAGMLSVNGGIHGLDKGRGSAMLAEAFDLCQREPMMAAGKPLDRHDQDLLTVLFYRHFSPVLFADLGLYATSTGPDRCNGQRLWVHRRGMQAEDLAYFRRALSEPLPPRIPAPPSLPASHSWIKKVRIRIATWRGRCPATRSGEFIPDGVKD